jgi:formate hydrogenlyase subunit 4
MASWLFFAAPVVAFTCMLAVPILIPVLTNFPLPLSDMGDILGGGLILTLGSFMIVLAGLDTSSAYGGIGSSRAVMVAILAEPTLDPGLRWDHAARQGDASSSSIICSCRVRQSTGAQRTSFSWRPSSSCCFSRQIGCRSTRALISRSI